jgi:hypothetical protein
MQQLNSLIQLMFTESVSTAKGWAREQELACLCGHLEGLLE